VWRYKKWRGIKNVFPVMGLASESKASGKWLPEKAGKWEWHCGMGSRIDSGEI